MLWPQASARDVQPLSVLIVQKKVKAFSHNFSFALRRYSADADSPTKSPPEARLPSMAHWILQNYEETV